MDVIQKLIFEKYNRWKCVGVILVGFTILYLIIRLFNIMNLPLFTDEAIYVRWSQIARYDASWRFISLTDGKQPSFVWITMVLMRFFSDPLFAGRFTSVLAGFFSMIGLFFLGRELFKNTKIGLITAALYLIYPMALVYDRMALYDSLVGATTIWALYFEVLLIRHIRLDIALILGMIIGAGMLTKTNAFFSLPFLVVILLLFDWKQKNWQLQLIKYLGLAIISAGIGFVMYSILRLSPFFHIINDKNTVFIYPLHEWLMHPFTFFIGNLRGLFDWLSIYLSYPFIALVCISFLLGVHITKERFQKPLITFGIVFVIDLIIYLLFVFFGGKDGAPESLPFLALVLLLASVYLGFREKVAFLFEKIVLVLWFGIPFLYLAFFGRTIYPRFILYMTLALLPLIAYSLYYLYELYKKQTIILVLGLLLFLLPLRADYYILNDFKDAPIPFADLEQYINGWPAGGGIKEIISYLSEQAKHQKIFVLSTGTFGSLPTYATEIYLGDNKNVDKKGIFPVPDILPQEYIDMAKKMPVYVFFSNQDEHLRPLSNWPITLIESYKKGSGEAESRLYLVNK